jgi:hypothetical protein
LLRFEHFTHCFVHTLFAARGDVKNPHDEGGERTLEVVIASIFLGQASKLSTKFKRKSKLVTDFLASRCWHCLPKTKEC